MLALAHRVRLPQPVGELGVELGRGDDPEVMHEEALRVRTGMPNARVLDATLEVEVAVERRLPRRQAGEAPAASLEGDRSLRDRIREWATRLGELDELAVEIDDLLGLLAQVSLDRPLVGRGPSCSPTRKRVGLSLVNGSRFQSLQRSRNVIPASRAIRSSSEGHT